MSDESYPGEADEAAADEAACEQPSPLTREQFKIELDFGNWETVENAYAAVLDTIAQQAQAIERLTLANEMLKGCVAEESRRLATMTTERDEAIERELYAKQQLALSEARHDEIRQLCDLEGVHHPEAAITKLKQQLATVQPPQE